MLATQALPLQPAEDDGRRGRGRAPGWGDREGPGARHHHPDRYRRRAGPHHRIPRPGDPRVVDGGPDDGVQHVDRGRRAGRHDRPGRDHVRLPSRPAARSRRAPTGTPPWRIGGHSRPTDDAEFDRGSSSMPPRCRRGSPGGPTRVRAAPLSGRVPEPADAAAERALGYMDLAPGTLMSDSRRRHRLHRLVHEQPARGPRAAADVMRGRQVAPGVRVLVVPGSVEVEQLAEAEGLDEVFSAAGAEWRGAGCSMCLGMNPDKLSPGQRSASTSNRNFEGRQGPGGRTHLVSPPVAAATAVTGRLPRPRTCSGSVEAMRPWKVHDPHRPSPSVRRSCRHRPDHPGRVPQAGLAYRVRRRPVQGVARRSGLRAQRQARYDGATVSSRGRTSVPAPRASTRSGRCRTTVSGP